MRLSDLIEGLSVVAVTGDTSREVSGIHFDSRLVEPGGVFFALEGVSADGRDFIPQALERGAAAIVAKQAYGADTDAVWIEVPDAREAMGRSAANWWGNPTRDLPVIGITGTNGKTTTALIAHHLLESSLFRAGLVGTIEYRVGDEVRAAPHTPPEAPDLQALFREMVDAGCRAAVMEVSSHGLVQHRTTGVRFDVGVFTNLSQDHLDYHGSMEAYFGAKCLLFERMEQDGGTGVMIVNADDRYGERLLKRRGWDLATVTFGQSAGADFQASGIRSGFDGTQFQLRAKGRQYLVRTPLIGLFNVYNTLAALAASVSAGLNMREAIANLATCPQVPGRLERVEGLQTNYRVFVDYAHTPDAVRNVLETVRSLEPKRLITVIGCGGDRDRGKRPLMAQAAEKASDYVILTSDNPRTEDPQQILRDAETGFHGTRRETVEDRKAAIGRAIDLAGERDIVVIAGKGHETYQEVNGVRHEFDDRKVAFGWMAAAAEKSKS